MPGQGTNVQDRPGAAKIRSLRDSCYKAALRPSGKCAAWRQGCLMLPTKFWAEMTWTDFQARDMARTIAVLPLSATEQHGPHLPLGTDTFIMEGYLARVVS